jgi:hypothetical protein
VAWKANTKQLIRDELGRDAAQASDEVGNPSVLGTTTDILDGVIEAYATYLSDLATRVRQPQPEAKASPATPIPAFCSYSAKDDAHRERLQVALAVLEREGILKMWEFRSLEAGTEWDSEIRKHLRAAKLILLLVRSGLFRLTVHDRGRTEDRLRAARGRHGSRCADHHSAVRLAAHEPQ